MNITIKNQLSGTRSYLGGIVTVSENSSTTISRDLNVIIVSDAQFLTDISNVSIIINNGIKDLNQGEAIKLIETLARFSTDPLATLFLYYSAPINIRQSTNCTVNTTVWALTNPSNNVYNYIIDSFFLRMGFDGATPLNAQSFRYDIMRFNTATPSGGTIITPSKYSSIAPNSTADIRYLDTGLTTTNVVFESSLDSIMIPAVKGTVMDLSDDFAFIKIAPGEGIAIRIADNDAISGLSLSGKVVWSHR